MKISYIEKKGGRLYFVMFILFIFLIGFVEGSEFSVWQGQYYTGNRFNIGTYVFNFSVYDAPYGGSLCFSNITEITTGTWGEWRTEQEDVGELCNDSSKEYFLNINIDGVDQSPRRRLTIFNYLRKDVSDTIYGDLIIRDVLFGSNPLKLQNAVSFVNSSKDEKFAIYIANPSENYSDVPEDFAGVLIHQIKNLENPYSIEQCWWHSEDQTIHFCINDEEVPGSAHTFRGCLQTVPNNLTLKENDRDFTTCEGSNFIDCRGGDFLAYGDIEATNIYANENMQTSNNLEVGGSLEVIGELIVGGNIEVGENIEVGGCIEYNCSSPTGCVTLGDCV